MAHSSPSITQRQLEALDAIDRLTRSCGYPPSGNEIAEAMPPGEKGRPISTQGLFDKLKALTVKGLITRTVGVHRSIKLTSAGLAVLEASRLPKAANEDAEPAQAAS